METLSELLDRCRSGDAEAVTALVERFRCWTLNLARALVRDDALAEDVVQEAFVAALQGLGSLRHAEAFPGWLRQILRRQASRMDRRWRDAASMEIEAAPDAGPCSSERIERDEVRQVVRNALDRLPPAERDAAVRFYLEQQGCAEIAHALSIPPGTVRRRLFDARARLRGMLLGHVSDEKPAPETKNSSTQRDLPF